MESMDEVLWEAKVRKMDVGDIGTQDITFTLNSVVTIADTGTF